MIIIENLIKYCTSVPGRCFHCIRVRNLPYCILRCGNHQRALNELEQLCRIFYICEGLQAKLRWMVWVDSERMQLAKVV